MLNAAIEFRKDLTKPFCAFDLNASSCCKKFLLFESNAKSEKKTDSTLKLKLRMGEC